VSVKRKFAAAALELVYEDCETTATVDSVDTADDEPRIGERHKVDHGTPSLLETAKEKAESAADALNTATKLHKLREEEAHSAKVTYQQAAYEAHIDALNLEDAQKKKRGHPAI
jgi:hypothetical protein